MKQYHNLLAKELNIKPRKSPKKQVNKAKNVENKGYLSQQSKNLMIKEK